MCCVLAAVLTLSVVESVTATAQVPSAAETEALQAKEQFKAGKFEVAARLFMQAYAKSHAPALVYNAARAYEEAGKKGDAISLFKLYITLSDDADGILDARHRIAKLEAPELAPSTPVVGPAKPPVIVLAVTPVPPADRTAAWWATGGALAAVASGAILIADGATGTKQNTGTNRPAYDAARSEWFVGAGLVGVGAVLGGLSVYLWSTSPVAVTPTPSGVALGGTF